MCGKEEIFAAKRSSLGVLSTNMNMTTFCQFTVEKLNKFAAISSCIKLIKDDKRV